MNIIPANIVDVAIIAFIAFSIIDGWRRGLFALIADLLALILSILFSLEIYRFASPFVIETLKVTEQSGHIISFFLVAFVLGSLLSLLFSFLLKMIPSAIRDSWPDRLAGSVGGLAKGFIYAGILLLLISSLPVLQPIKDRVNESRYAPPLVARSKVIASNTERYLKSRFGGLVEDTFALLTVKPGEGGVNLGFKTTKVSIDEEAEEEMLRLDNAERAKAGLAPLSMDQALREAARAHSRDMFERGYFAHDTPEGITPSERLTTRNITYGIMGENLALAPDVNLAHRGLMNSPTHRENILFPEFKKIGIGALNGGIYGIMFSQEFTD